MKIIVVLAMIVGWWYLTKLTFCIFDYFEDKKNNNDTWTQVGRLGKMPTRSANVMMFVGMPLTGIYIAICSHVFDLIFSD
jgi:hypothetical protein